MTELIISDSSKKLITETFILISLIDQRIDNKDIGVLDNKDANTLEETKKYFTKIHNVLEGTEDVSSLEFKDVDKEIQKMAHWVKLKYEELNNSKIQYISAEMEEKTKKITPLYLFSKKEKAEEEHITVPTEIGNVENIFKAEDPNTGLASIISADEPLSPTESIPAENNLPEITTAQHDESDQPVKEDAESEQFAQEEDAEIISINSESDNSSTTSSKKVQFSSSAPTVAHFSPKTTKVYSDENDIPKSSQRNRAKGREQFEKYIAKYMRAN